MSIEIKLACEEKNVIKQLIAKIIADAKQIGYQHRLLDTLPFFHSAIGMYKKAGFYEIDSYNNSPMDTSIYTRLDLDKTRRKQMNYQVVDQIKEQDQEEIFQGLLEYNLSKIEDKNPKDLGIYLNDESGKKVAGLIGDTHGNWLLVKYLWVSKELRGQKIGQTILAKAEEEARKRGCKYAFLDTFSFQAPEFYKKYGYQVVFTLEEYPLTGQRYYFTKKL